MRDRTKLWLVPWFSTLPALDFLTKTSFRLYLYFTDSCSFSAPTFLIFSLSSSSSVLRRKHNTNNWLSQAMSSLWFLKLSLKCLDHLAWYLCNACFFFIASLLWWSHMKNLSFTFFFFVLLVQCCEWYHTIK